jgi:hypothetical protein
MDWTVFLIAWIGGAVVALLGFRFGITVGYRKGFKAALERIQRGVFD